MNALRFDNIGGIHMVTVKRQRKRSLVNPRGRQVIAALSALLALALIAGAIALVALVRLNGRMEDLNGYIAKSIRTDINQAIQCYDTLERRGDDAAADALGSMKRYMYSAYGMNRLLVEARGERYALLDASAFAASVAVRISEIISSSVSPLSGRKRTSKEPSPCASAEKRISPSEPEGEANTGRTSDTLRGIRSISLPSGS